MTEPVWVRAEFPPAGPHLFGVPLYVVFLLALSTVALTLWLVGIYLNRRRLSD